MLNLRCALSSTLVCAFALMSVATPANAGEQYGLIERIDLRSGDGGNDSLVVITLDRTAASTDKPACAKYPYWIIRDAKSPIGQQQIAVLMTAKATQKPVRIVGSNTCTRWGDGEDIFQVSWTE